jgi:hypothetical protein
MKIMFSAEFLDLISELIPIGNRNYANDVRKFIYNETKNNDFIDFDNDEIYLEPLFLPYFLHENKEATLEQIICSFKEIKEDFYVLTNEKGIIYIPRMGYFYTEYFNEKLLSKFDEKGINFFFKGNPVSYKMKPIEYVKGTNIEYIIDDVPYLGTTIGNANPQSKLNPLIKELSKLHKKKFSQTISLIKVHHSFFYEWFDKVVKKLIVFKHEGAVSFASARSNGIPYLSANENSNLIFFLEDIVHQTAHNILNTALFFKKEELFTVSPESTINDSILEGDHRDLFGVFHGLFTQSCINLFFDTLIDKEVFKSLELYEIKGRLSDNMKRWESSLSIFQNSNILTDLGEFFFDEFVEIYEKINQKRGNIIYKYDTSNQPYIFNYEEFLKLNPHEEA